MTREAPSGEKATWGDSSSMSSITILDSGRSGGRSHSPSGRNNQVAIAMIDAAATEAPMR